MNQNEALTGITYRCTNTLGFNQRGIEITTHRAKSAWEDGLRRGLRDGDDLLDYVLDVLANGDLDRRVALGGARGWAFVA